MSHHQLRRFVIASSLTVTFAVGVCASALAQSTGNSTPPSQYKALQSQLDSSLQASSLMRVYRDPKTGEFVQQENNISTLDANTGSGSQRTKDSTASAARNAPIAIKQHANGMRSASLGERGMHYATAHRHADGSLHTNCADEHGLADALTKPTSANAQQDAEKGAQHAR